MTTKDYSSETEALLLEANNLLEFLNARFDNVETTAVLANALIEHLQNVVDPELMDHTIRYLNEAFSCVFQVLKIDKNTDSMAVH
jgi:hypothetical protein